MTEVIDVLASPERFLSFERIIAKVVPLIEIVARNIDLDSIVNKVNYISKVTKFDNPIRLFVSKYYETSLTLKEN